MTDGRVPVFGPAGLRLRARGRPLPLGTSMSQPPRHELFPEEDYRFRIGVRRGDLDTFFRPSPDSRALLAERRRWLEGDPERYVALTDTGRPLLAAFHGLASRWENAGGCVMECAALGATFEPDFLLLAADDTGDFRLHGGALCFPTGWALEEKLGRTIDEIHGVVPGLNTAVGPAIGRFLARLVVGEAWERVNWGLAATPELNLHPALERPRLSAACEVDAMWLRVEHQILAALPPPAARGVLFAIRIENTPLRCVLEDPVARCGFARALATMDDAVAAYKGLAGARPRLLELAAGSG